MDGFISTIAPVISSSMTKEDLKKKDTAYYKSRAKKKDKEQSFEEQFSAVYIPGLDGDPPPITYERPKGQKAVY